ncbi:hypothetical protein [Bradyrhizobium sp. Tv2a-2]|uniref:hypothetical protein n=1 Tax=Bradyrhizobium sp. Tv2a-2 TaxID=113395 RepID=UPI000411A941|nr:hypothetical protein [Bradyrhizobium sp. Tv2a-2]
MHEAETRLWTLFGCLELPRRGNHRLQAVAVERPKSDFPAFAQEVDAVRDLLSAAATDQLQERLRQTRVIDGKLLIKDVIAELRQQLPMPVSNFQLQQPHAAFNGTSLSRR